jgi:hypothetical protein
MTDFKLRAAAALDLAGVPFTEGDLDVVQVVAQVFGPAMSALDNAPLEDLPFEAAVDPGSAPATRAGS